MYTTNYLVQQVETASPAQLVTLLYDGALAAIGRALARPDHAETVNHELQRAQAIITELRVTLDFDNGGEVAERLEALYAWFLEQLVTSNVTKDLEPLRTVAEQLATLREAWVEAMATMPAHPADAAVAQGLA